jgi:hypothetical protein
VWYWNQTQVTFNNPLYFFNGAGPPTGLPVFFGALGVSGGRVVLKSKKVGETLGYPIDFISTLAASEVISTAVVTASVYSGVDPNPSFIVLGTPTIQGTVVQQGITGGVLGTIYELLYAVTTSLNQLIEISAFLAIVSDLP